MSNPLTDLDVLIDQLNQALADSDWDRIAELDGTIADCVAPAMTALARGELSPDPVQQRLEQLQAFCDQAQAGAEQARTGALKALKEINRNRSAARAYQDVSGRGPG